MNVNEIESLYVDLSAAEIAALMPLTGSVTFTEESMECTCCGGTEWIACPSAHSTVTDTDEDGAYHYCNIAEEGVAVNGTHRIMCPICKLAQQ